MLTSLELVHLFPTTAYTTQTPFHPIMTWLSQPLLDSVHTAVREACPSDHQTSSSQHYMLMYHTLSVHSHIIRSQSTTTDHCYHYMTSSDHISSLISCSTKWQEQESFKAKINMWYELSSYHIACVIHTQTKLACSSQLIPMPARVY